jgi:hypothetical protein
MSFQLAPLLFGGGDDESAVAVDLPIVNPEHFYREEWVKATGEIPSLPWSPPRGEWRSSCKTVPAQLVDATLSRSLVAGV